MPDAGQRSVMFNFLGRDFFNALAEKDADRFAGMIVKWLCALCVGIPVFVFRDYYQVRQGILIQSLGLSPRTCRKPASFHQYPSGACQSRASIMTNVGISVAQPAAWLHAEQIGARVAGMANQAADGRLLPRPVLLSDPGGVAGRQSRPAHLQRHQVHAPAYFHRPPCGGGGQPVLLPTAVSAPCAP